MKSMWSSSPRFNTETAQRGLKTPRPDGKSDKNEESLLFAEYGLSPPARENKRGATFKEAERRIKKEFKQIWDSGEGDEKKILLFLYGRGFHRHTSKPHRIRLVMQMLKGGAIRERMLQVIKSDGDIDYSSIEKWQLHFIGTCLTLHRYFQQDGATGFMKDMSSLSYFLRLQRHGSCFLQSSCVTMSYILQSHGRLVAPADASRLIRHKFNDDQLFQYIVKDKGGDSVAILQLLEQNFFDSDFPSRQFESISCSSLERKKAFDYAVDMIQEGPGLVAKFSVPNNFRCERDVRPGYARFTEWNAPAVFFPLDNPSHDASIKIEETLKARWKESFVSLKSKSSLVDTYDLSATFTASTSMEEGSIEHSSGLDDDSQGDASLSESEDSTEEELEYRLEDGEGNDSQLHAMILLGIHHVGEETFWVLQNSWDTLQIIEMSTQYISKSGACFIFFSKKGRSPRNLDTYSVQTCPSPIAESSQLERTDCESWKESLVFS